MRVLWLAMVVACSKSEPPPAQDKPPELLPAPELERAADACNGYVTKICACANTVEAAKAECSLAKALPEAIDIAKRLAANPKADREDAVQAAGSVRKTVKQCIEKTASLPALGCP